MKQSASNQSVQQRGAVSLIVVIFTALLVTVITIGFVSLMVRSQQQATQSDLSQSAYDSALIGLEDAKRVLLLDKKCKETGDDSTICTRIRGILEADPSTHTCSDVKKMLTGPEAEGETLVGEGEGEQKLLQAYSCAKISPNTVDYRQQGLDSAESHIIPLTVEPLASFDTIEIMWFTQKDALSASANLALPSALGETPLPVPDGDKWTMQMPPIVRAQFMQVAKTFTLSQFNDAGGPGESNSSTVFLYPSSITIEENSFDFDSSLPESSKKPMEASCKNARFRGSDYACKMILAVPNPKNGGPDDLENRPAFLRLSALYNKTSYRIVLRKGGSTGAIVPFYGVQPEVDVTGRANDVYRRIKARVQLDAKYPYPESAVDLNGNLCKDFTVTGDASTYDDVNRVERCNPRGSSD